MGKKSHIGEKAQEASYSVTEFIDQKGQSQTVGETLVTHTKNYPECRVEFQDETDTV